MTRGLRSFEIRPLGLHFQPLIGIERRQIIEMHLVPDLFWIVEIDLVDLEQRKIALAFLGAPYLAFDCVAGAQPKAPDLAGAHIDIVRAWQVIRVGRAKKSEAVLKDFYDAIASNLDFACRKLLQYRKHQLLLAQSARILNCELLSYAQEFSRRLNFKVLQFHFLHFWGLFWVL